jgi:hypothetical protein
MSDIAEAKRKLPLPSLMQQLGLHEHAKKSARCPFHEDQHASFSVWRTESGAWLFKCHTGCGQGDEINFLELHKAISRSDATKLYLEMAGVAQTSRGQPPAKKSNSENPKPFDWQPCVDALTERHLERLGEWRGYSGAFCSWLHKRGLVGLHNCYIAFPVHDRAGIIVAAHYRRKDGSWGYDPRGTKARPLIIGNLKKATQIHVFESQWDGFALCDKLAIHETDGVGVIVTRGAGNGALVGGLIQEGATVFAWEQNDCAGNQWLKVVCDNA